MYGTRSILSFIVLFGVHHALAESAHDSNVAADNYDANSQSDQTAFNYRMALQELEVQVELGNIPPEAVAQILERIAPILDRVDQSSEQDIQVLRSSQSPSDLKVIVKTRPSANGNGGQNTESTSALPKIAKSDPDANSGSSSSASAPPLAVAAQMIPIVTGPMTVPQSKKFQEFTGILSDPQGKPTPSRSINVINAGTGSGNISGNSNGAATPAGSNSDKPTFGDSAPIVIGAGAAAVSTPSKTKSFIQKIVAAFTGKTDEEKTPSKRLLAQVAKPSEPASALAVPKMSADALTIAAPTLAEPTPEIELEAAPGDATGWVIGTLMALLAVKAFFQWRKREAWRRQG